MEEYGFTKSWSNQTQLHPLAGLMLFAACCAIFSVKRKHVLIPMLAMACFVASAQRIVIAGLDLDLLRIMIMAGLARVFMKREFQFKWSALDSLVVAFGVATFLVTMSDMRALVATLGNLCDAFGMYFLVRVCIRSWDDARGCVMALLYLSVPVAMMMTLERLTGKNPFAMFGGVPPETAIRDGRLRCQGAFSHPILAGCFWASMLPLFAAQWWNGQRGKMLAIVGCVSAMMCVVYCASSTPLAAIGIGGLAWCLFPLRKKMRLIRWSIVATLLGLHIGMNAPIWHLIARVQLVGGSTGWHRYRLINACVSRFREWAVIGDSRGTAHWGWGLQDCTNYYIAVAVQGGVGLIALFLTQIGFAFRAVGISIHAKGMSKANLMLAWAFGISLLMHCANYMSVCYFGQIGKLWYVILGIIGSTALASQAIEKQWVKQRAQQPARRMQPARHHDEPVLAGGYGLREGLA